MQLMETAIWIEGTFIARFIAMSPHVYALISAFHLLGIALLFGSIVPVDLRLLGLLDRRFDVVLSSLVRFALLGFAVAAPSGALLASVRLTDYVQNPAFLAKMFILITAGANALLLRAGSLRLPDTPGRPAARFAAMMSLSLWAAAILAGRWIAFA